MPSEMTKNQKIAALTCIALVCVAAIVGAAYLLRWALKSMALDVPPIVINFLQFTALFLCYGYFAKLILAEVRRKS
jgi:hypothetical protein